MGAGTLYIVATPIGNLEDITLRAIRVLKTVDLIAAEDTRRSARLLHHYQISTKMTSYHDFTDTKKRKSILHKILSGNDVALISDAGTPGISDPGYRLIVEALSEAIEVHAVPGPSVLTAALSVSGLPTDRFYFCGFLPKRSGPRKTRLRSLGSRTETLVCYESPHRILATLKEMKEILASRKIAVFREMTKLHEEVYRGSLEGALDHFRDREKIRGEFTLVLEGNRKNPRRGEKADLQKALREVIQREKVTRKDAVRIVSETFGLPKKEVYRESLKK